MKRIRLLLFGLLCLMASSAFAQLTIGTVDPGPYTPGSTIAATFTINNASCIAIGNTFQLYLSDSNGNFGSETLIGTYNGFYTTFVNGLLPAGITPGTGYKVRIKSTNPALVSNESAAFEIKAGPAVEAKLSSLPINNNTQEAFGSCAGRDNFNYAFTNESTATSTVTATVKNEMTGGAPTTIAFTTPIQTYNASLAHFTVFTKAVMPDGTLGTKAYFLINNQTVTAFSTSGNNVVCLPNSQLEFGVDISSDGILKNFPGDTYVVNWGDQSTSTYTLCDIRQNAGKIRHTYTRSSCGNVFSGSSGTEYNVFAVNISVENPYCGRVGSTISSTAKVITKPVNTFSSPLTACTNATVTFANTSIQGEDPNTNSPGCQPNTVTYNWYVDGVLVAANKPISFNLTYQFTTHGNHTIRLESTSSGACDADPYSTTICIQDPPQPAFNLSANPICQGATVTLTNTSVVDNICGNNTTYAWSVSPGTGVSFVGGTTNSSQNPQIRFNTIGLYTITLAVTSGNCTTVTTSKQLVVNTAPTATLAPDAQLCGTNTYTFDDTPGSVTRVTFTGTVQEPVSTYTWTVVADNGGTWSFVNGTNANSKYPQIKFDSFDTYTITVTHTNNCSTASDSQKITFNTAPVVNAGPDQSICYNDVSFTLAGSITGATTTQVWTGGNGTFTPNRNTLNATYTPTTAEKNAGTVTLTLTGTTTLPAPCNSVADQVVLTIKPRITVNSAASKSICTGDAVAYSPTSNRGAGTTFSWTATGSATAGGFNAGNGATINDALTNSSPTANATVTYTITPSFDGCAGDPFTFTVTVTPRPILTATPANAIICSGQGTAIGLSSNLSGTKYTWTSTAQAGITGNSSQATQTTTTSINQTLTNSLTTSATVDYIITPYSASGCAGTPVTVTITVAPTPSTPNAGADQSICSTSSYVLNGNQPTVGTGKWSLVSAQSGVTFVDDTQYNTTVNGLVAGQTYTFRWTISGAATCTPKSDDVLITVNPPSVGGTTAGSTAVCSNSNSGQITLSGQVGAIVRWERSTDGGTTWLPISNTTTTLTYTNLTATTQYRAVVKNGACAPENSSVSTITVNPAVVPANAGPDQLALCNVTSTTLAGNSPLTNTGKWTVSSGQTGVVFADDTQFNTQVSGLVPGQTYVFTWTISGLAPCAPSADDVTVKIDLPSNGGTTAGSTAVCSNSNSGQITLSGQTGSVLRWERSTDGGATWITIANTTTALNYTNLTTTTQYRAVVQNGACGPANSSVATVTVNPAVVASNAGPDQTLCNATTTTLAGNSPLTNTGKWTQKSGPAGVVFADDTQFNTQVSGLVPGQTYVFTWTISGLAPCPPSASDVQIVVNAPSNGGITAGSTTVCSGSNSGSITLSGQLGNIIRWERSTDGGATWSPISNTTATQSYNNLTVTTQYRAVVQNGNCAPANSAVATITVNPLSITANAGPDQELCDQTSTTLAGNSPQTQTGLWTQTGGPAGAVFADATQYNTQVSGLIPGNTYTFTWTISGLAPCPPSASSVQVLINAQSNGGTTAGSTTVCSGSGSGNITLSGQVGNIIRWESSTDGGATWTPISNTTASIAYSNLTVTTQYRAVVKNGNCAPANSSVSTITVNPLSISANAGPNQELCDQTSTTLAGNSPQTQTGLWTQTGGPAGAVFADATLYNTQVSGLIPGNTYTFTWTISGLAPCPPSASSVTIKINAASNGGITAGSTAVCSGSGSGNITLSGYVGTIQGWESSTDGGATWTPINNTTTSVAYSNLTITTQYRAIVKNGNCAPAYSSVAIITVNPGSIAAVAGPNQELCDQTSTTLAGNSPQTQTGLWTQTGGPAGAVFADASLYNTQVSGLIPGNTYTFTWTISGLAPCPPSSASVTIKINAASNGGTLNGSTAVCSGSNNGTITLSGQVGAIQGWESSTDGGTTWTPINSTSSSITYNNLTATTQYRAIVKNGNCAAAYSAVATVTVNQAVVQATAGPDQTLCNTPSLTLQGNSPLSNTGLWTLTSGQSGVTFADPTQYNTQVSGLVGGQTYTFRWTISGLAPCPPTSDEVSITILAPLGNTNITTPFLTACNGQVITLTGNAPTGGNGSYTYVWESSNDGGTTWTTINGQTGPSLNVTVNMSLSYRRTVTSGQCVAVSNVLQITVLPAIANNTIAANQSICLGSAATPITGSQPTGGDGSNYAYGWEQSTDNGATWTAIIGANGQNYAPGAITQTTSYRRLVSSGACAGSLQSVSNVVKVTVNPNAKAEFTFTRDLDCFPFVINAANIKATAYPDRNATYTWYADNVLIGTGINFPGYTIATENTAVVIKLVVTSSLGCSQDEMSHTFRTRPNIQATFTPSLTSGCGPLTVDFTNTSTTLTGVTFEWRVNNVVVGTSADLRYAFAPDAFGEDKDYTVTLTVIGPCGRSVSAPQKITVYAEPIATGTPDKTRGCSPLTVNFRNTSPGSTNTFTYEIDGVVVNGPSASKADFAYVFTTDVVREYKVKVTATNACGTDSREYVIVVSPNTIRPGFTVDGNKLRGCAPFDVDFINSTVGASQYVYQFEPNQSAEVSVNNRPEVKRHRFEKPGTYVVTMLATNDCSTAPLQSVTITVDPQPVAAFSANLTIGCDGLEVKFTNTSKDAISYVWDFGDGSPVSTEVAPTHVYKGNARNFTVTLTAINSLGCPTTETKIDYIRLVGPPKADFSISPAAVISIPNYTFKFTNESTNGAQTYKWTFGDGDASTLKDPAHTYLDTGRFLVTLRTYTEQGCVDSIQKYVHIVGVPGYVYLPNSFMPGGTSVPLQKFIAVGAGIKSWKMSVFNKWGQVLWETTKLEDGKPVEGWDGTYNGVAQPQGIYFWKMEVQLINGTEWKGVTLDKSAPKRTGEIYLIR